MDRHRPTQEENFFDRKLPSFSNSRDFRPEDEMLHRIDTIQQIEEGKFDSFNNPNNDYERLGSPRFVNIEDFNKYGYHHSMDSPGFSPLNNAENVIRNMPSYNSTQLNDIAQNTNYRLDSSLNMSQLMEELYQLKLENIYFRSYVNQINDRREVW